MNSQTLECTLKSASLTAKIIAALALLVGVYFLCFYSLFAGGWSYTRWNWSACNSLNGMIHGRAVPILFLVFIFLTWQKIKDQPVKPSWWGLVGVVLFFLLYLLAVRTKQPRIILMGMPFLVLGCTQFLFGWKVTKYMIFPAFFLWFAMPLPQAQQATARLQIIVTEMCWFSGNFFGMDIARRGNEIISTTGSWDMNIAEGCSGIRSLMALVMIAAIFGYYTQKANWKKGVIWFSALPLAMLGNYGRIFTIMVLNEMGFTDFAVGAYHNWAGLLIFFPIALVGLFTLDRLLNPQKLKLRKRSKKRVVKKVGQGSATRSDH